MNKVPEVVVGVAAWSHRHPKYLLYLEKFTRRRAQGTPNRSGNGLQLRESRYLYRRENSIKSCFSEFEMSLRTQETSEKENTGEYSQEKTKDKYKLVRRKPH